jgi:hypothetical protein
VRLKGDIHLSFNGKMPRRVQADPPLDPATIAVPIPGVSAAHRLDFVWHLLSPSLFVPIFLSSIFLSKTVDQHHSDQALFRTREEVRQKN